MEEKYSFHNILTGKTKPKDKSNLHSPKVLGGRCLTKWGSYADYNKSKKEEQNRVEWDDVWKEEKMIINNSSVQKKCL